MGHTLACFVDRDCISTLIIALKVPLISNWRKTTLKKYVQLVFFSFSNMSGGKGDNIDI